MGSKLNCEHRTTQNSHKVTFHLVLTCDLCHVCLILPSHNRCPLLFCLNSLLCSISDFPHQSLSPDLHIHLLTFVSLNSTYTSPPVLQSAATSSVFLCPSALQSSDPELKPKPVPACLPPFLLSCGVWTISFWTCVLLFQRFTHKSPHRSCLYFDPFPCYLVHILAN